MTNDLERESQYLNKTLKPPLLEIGRGGEEEGGGGGRRGGERKVEAAKKILCSLLLDPMGAPLQLRVLLKTLKEEAEKKGCDGHVLVGGLFLLRIVTPALINYPRVFGVSKPPSHILKGFFSYLLPPHLLPFPKNTSL